MAQQELLTLHDLPVEYKEGAPAAASQPAAATQDLEAIERQQVPPDAADFLKGYYENLGGGKKK